MAWGRVGQIIRALPPTQAFDLACHLIHKLPGSYLPTFGGGTLAHLVHYHGATLIDWIEHEAWRDVDFLTALSNAWVAGEDVHPTLLIRLRVATGAGIHIVRRQELDAAYKRMFERWIRTRPQRRKKPSRAREADLEALDHSALPVAGARATADIPKAVPHSKRMELWMRFSVLSVRLLVATWSKPRRVQYMVRGAFCVWLVWVLLTTVSAPLLLPVLVVVLGIISASPVTDLMLVALTFVLATVGAAVAGLAIGVVSERRRQVPNDLVYAGVMSLTPYVTVTGLIARSEHGIVVAPAVLTGLLAGPYIGHLVRKRKLRSRTTQRRSR